MYVVYHASEPLGSAVSCLFVCKYIAITVDYVLHTRSHNLPPSATVWQSTALAVVLCVELMKFISPLTMYMTQCDYMAIKTFQNTAHFIFLANT